MDTFYAECEYCGPLPVYGDASPETTDRGHVDDTVDEHMERYQDHIVKVWQLVSQQGTGRVGPPCCAYHASTNTAVYGRPCGRIIDGRA